MTNRRDRAAIVEQIAKLLVLSENSAASSSEAANAAAAAARLMAKHDIERAAVEAVRQDQGDLREHAGNEALWTGSRASEWRELLAGGIAQIHCCRIIVQQVPSYALNIIGYTDDVALVRHLFAYLEKSVERLVRRAQSRQMIHGRRSAYSFRLGFIQTVLRRLELMRREVEREFVEEKKQLGWEKERVKGAIVRVRENHLVTMDAVEEYAAKKYPGMGRGKFSEPPVDYRSYVYGNEAGLRIPLRPALKEEEQED